ncbi:hypothetical protein AGOR_G00082810 [Albula goreensis]|uniref:Cilia- and flagella-associated protein 61 N-terminal domain-containing protein n=1 Tax=Albula goreensis TaxID=1534307 RepID=A0A8T3DMM3_9TELE|nr:hypothetical protein AGOR_G00082810 [Albula goreensis]
MRTVTNWCDDEETISVRRTESSDAREINDLITPATEAVFGRVNVIYLLEKANLAVTVTNSKNEVLAHAAFLDHPSTDLVDPAGWEPWLHKHFSSDKSTPLNTLFLHLFVAQPDLSLGCAKEIARTVFSAIIELHYVFLVITNSACLEPALLEIFEPLGCLQSQCQWSAFVCHRHNFCPTLHVRRARVEDHDDLTHLLAEQAKVCSTSYGPYFLAELIDAQNDDFHAAVCENEGTAVGFISVSGNVNLTLLNECFELGPFNGLSKTPLANPTGSAETESPEESSNATCEDPEEKDPKSVPEPEQNVLNAFCIQLFFIDKKYEMRSVDFLPYIFKLFPDRDFCVISVPKLGPEFPLLQTFLRAVPQSSSTLPHELYIYHRSGLLKTFEVRITVSSDRHAIESLLKKLSLHESMLEDLDKFYQARQNKDGTPMQVFVAQVVEQVVGILIIKNEEDIDYIRAHYNIENFIYFSHHQREEHGQLCHFALNPIFQHYAKHFLKEALRLSHKSCLYYPIYPSYLTQKNASAHSLTSALSSMVPVRPRRQIIYPLEELGLNAPSRQVTADQTPYALNHINRKLTMEPKATVNIRIVVVGASDTGISFLEVLAFCPHLRFNNLTLISKLGLPSYCNNEKTSFLATSHSYTDRDYAQLSLRSWVNVIEGKMMGINRADKHVLVSGDRKVPYDHLILCTGQQYQVPCPSGVDISQPITNSELPVQAEQRYTGAIPSNLLTLNDDHDCQRAHSWLLENFVDLEGDVVIYGNTIDVFTCVTKLLSMGVAGNRIKVVHPPTDSQLTCFSSPAVEEAVRAALRRSEVQVHRDGLLAQLNDGQDPEPLSSVSFTTQSQPIRMKCAVFINFFRKGVDYNAFKSINDACLVYDGRLVIDSKFHTNDSTIRAAGPLTKFARSYHADQWSHAGFNSKEVGVELARALLPFFDPTLESETTPSAPEDQLIPLYSQAKIQGGTLPGGYSYLHVTRPAINPSKQSLTESAKYGREIGTGKVEEGNYFRLFLNQFGLVESLTCLSKEPFPVSNYLCLYGRHELLLNRLCARFDEGLITDLYSFFKERWCMAIYHDRFVDFEEEVRQIIESANVQDEDNLLLIPEIIQKMVEEQLVTSEDPNLYLQNVFAKSDGLTPLKRGVLNYLKYNRYHLTMYAQPEFM